MLSVSNSKARWICTYSSSFKRIRYLNSGVEVGSVHGGSESISGRVTELDHLLLGLEFGDGANRTKDLFLHDLHVLGNIGENSGLNKITLVTLAVAANLNLRTCVLTGLDVSVSALATHPRASRLLIHTP